MIFNVSTNAAGAAGVFIFPNQPTTAGVGNMYNSFYSILNDVSFNPDTGTYTPGT